MKGKSILWESSRGPMCKNCKFKHFAHFTQNFSFSGKMCKFEFCTPGEDARPPCVLILNLVNALFIYVGIFTIYKIPSSPLNLSKYLDRKATNT